jgi:fructose-bisphosphate aldolase class II
MSGIKNDTNALNSTNSIMNKACQAGIAILAFNVPYLPMIEPVIRAVVDQNSFALIEVARLEWEKFESKSPRAVIEEFLKWQKPNHVRIHLDHVPVIDEDGIEVDYPCIIQQAISLGYQSVMVDGSRLSLEDNISATLKIVELAHNAGISCEAELGAVLGHEAGPLPPYDELFESGRGFTGIQEAKRFVLETHCDWLSVAIGNIHGNISKAMKDEKKVAARLNLDHLESLHRETGIPLVLHGGSGVQKDYLTKAIKKGITKINIGTDIRQPYELALKDTGSIRSAQEALYERTKWIISDYFNLTNSKEILIGR